MEKYFRKLEKNREEYKSDLYVKNSGILKL
jgi:hypothetical protein